MHYIEYIPGTIARITDKPTRHGHEDVNLLSHTVCKFNDWVKYNSTSHSQSVEKFVTLFSFCQLPCSS